MAIKMPSEVGVLPAPPPNYLILQCFLALYKDATYPRLVPWLWPETATETRILVSELAILPFSLCAQN